MDALKKLCFKCHHYEDYGIYRWGVCRMYPIGMRENRIIYHLCGKIRMDETKCGREGKYFVQRFFK